MDGILSAVALTVDAFAADTAVLIDSSSFALREDSFDDYKTTESDF